jgi:hypothetical protein
MASRRFALPAVGLVISALAVGLGVALVNAQRSDRAELRQRFAERAALAGTVVESVLSPFSEQASNVAAAQFGDSISASEFSVHARRREVAGAALLDGSGLVIAASDRALGEPGGALRGITPATRSAITGREPGISGLELPQSPDAFFETAVPLDTTSGPGTLVTRYSGVLLGAFLGSSLEEVTATGGTRAFVFDTDGDLIANAGGATDLDLLRANREGEGTVEGEAGTVYFATKVGRTGWRTALTTPEATLYAPAGGGWLTWSVLAGFTLAALLSLLLLRRVQGDSTLLARLNAALEDRHLTTLSSLAEAREETIARLALAAEFRDDATARHTERMTLYCKLLAGRAGMGAERQEMLRLASLMHDVGKIGVPDAILTKPGPLTEKELAVMRHHTEDGWRILSGSNQEMLDMAATVARSHHERVDGSGYPDGLSGEEIPLEARIAAIADVFDALTSNRIYRPAFSFEEAIEIMRDGRGTQFDPELLELFLQGPDEVRDILERKGASTTAASTAAPGAPAGA